MTAPTFPACSRQFLSSNAQDFIEDLMPEIVGETRAVIPEQ